MAWLSELVEFCEDRLACAGRAGLEAEIARDMAVLETSLLRLRNPLWRLLSEVAVKGFVLSAELGPHRPVCRQMDTWHALLFTGEARAADPAVEIAGLASLDPADLGGGPRLDKILKRLHHEGLAAELGAAPYGGLQLCLRWPAGVFAGFRAEA